jgi:hypothetical protein
MIYPSLALGLQRSGQAPQMDHYSSGVSCLQLLTQGKRPENQKRQAIHVA